MRKEIDVFDYASEILKAVKKGALLTTKADNKVNTMTIAWGSLGIEWGKPIFTAFVRENRFTRSNWIRVLNLQLISPMVILIKRFWGYAERNPVMLLIKFRS